MYRASEITIIPSESRPLHMEGEILFGDQMHFTIQPLGMTVLTGAG